MKIGIDARPLISQSPSGIGVYLIHVLEYVALDTENEYYLYTNKPLGSKKFCQKNFHVVLLPGLVGTLWLCYRLKKQLQMDEIEVFWGTQHMLPLNASEIKTVVTVHDLALLLNPSWGSMQNAFMQNVFAKKSCRIANKIITVSQATSVDVMNLLNVSPDKINVVLSGFDSPNNDSATVEQIKRVESKFKLLDKKYFLYLGTIEPRKNIVNIVQAFNHLNAQYDGAYNLVIAGGLGWKVRSILREIEKSPFSKQIFLPGYVSREEKFVLLQQAISFVFPSYYEGFGLPVLEALNCGTPVITSGVSSLPEVGGDNAYYVDDPHDFVQISALMKKTLELDESERSAFTCKSKKWCEQFSWELCAQKTIACIASASKCN